MSTAFYFLHLVHNIDQLPADQKAIWHSLNTIALLACTLCIPWTMSHITVINAILAPDNELVARVVHEEKVYEMDCADMKKQLEDATRLGFLTPRLIDELEEKVTSNQ